MGGVKESDKESVPAAFSYHPLLLHICLSPVPWGKKEREPLKKKNKKRRRKKKKTRTVIALF